MSLEKNPKNKIDFILEFIWLVIIFLVPLFLVRGVHNAFEIPKNILFQGLTEVLLFFYLVKLVLEGWPSRRFLWSRVKYLWPAFIFIIVLGLSTIFSQVPWFSFWGSWERRMGYLSWLHFFVFALILLINIKSNRQVYRLLLITALTSFLVTIYGFIQALGLEPFEWSYNPFLTKRIFSTIGQPNFLGSWLLLVIPLSLFGIIKKKSFLRILSFISVLLLISALVLTKSRGALIGLIALIGFISFFFLWRKNKKLIMIPIFCFLSLVGLIIFINKKGIDNTRLVNYPSLYRLQTFANLEMAGQYRLMHWRASLDLIKQRPILGYGLGAQRFNFPRYYQPEFAMYEKPNIYLDYAHNDILDMLLIAGFLGLVSYLFWLGSVFWRGLKYFLNKRENGVLVLLILAGLFGYLVSLLFSFHIMSTIIYFWLFIILVIILTRESASSDPSKFSQNLDKPGGLTLQKSLIILLLLVLLIVSFWQFNGRLYLSSYYLQNAKKAKAVWNLNELIINHQRAIKFSPDDPYFRQEFALSLYQISALISTSELLNQKSSPSFKTKLDWLNLGIKNISAIPYSKRPIEALIWLPWLNAEKAYLTQQESDFMEAEKNFEKVAAFSPQTALIYNKWCNLKIYQRDWTAAIEKCEKAIALYPSINHPHINLEHQRNVVDEMVGAYLSLADIYQQVGNSQKTIDILKKSAYLIVKVYSPPYPENLKFIYRKLIKIYATQGDLNLALSQTHHAYTLWPNDHNLAMVLSSFYAELGEESLADFWLKNYENNQLK